MLNDLTFRVPRRLGDASLHPASALKIGFATGCRTVELGKPLRAKGLAAAGSFAGDDDWREHRELLERRAPLRLATLATVPRQIHKILLFSGLLTPGLALPLAWVPGYEVSKYHMEIAENSWDQHDGRSTGSRSEAVPKQFPSTSPA